MTRFARSIGPRALVALGLAAAIVPVVHVATVVAQAPATAAVASIPQPLAYVDDVRLTIQKSNPPKLVIQAEGRAPTPGYIDVAVRFRREAPADGIYAFDLVGVPPLNYQIQIPAEATAAPLVRDPLPPDLKGVRVHAQHNAITVMLDGTTTREGDDGGLMMAAAPVGGGAPQNAAAAAAARQPAGRYGPVAYAAQQLADDSVILKAMGKHRTIGYRVSLAARPADPNGGEPAFEFRDEPPGGPITFPMITPFSLSATASAGRRVDTVRVFDVRANREVKVSVEQVRD